MTTHTRILGLLCIILTTSISASADEVGHTSGGFSVGKQGEATYEIPIAVPPGAAGLQPDLALVYNSNAGNGQLGTGWSIAGLSGITRCPATMAQDGVAGAVRYQDSDKFCLDGQRLMNIDGVYGANDSRYRTEIESFQDVYAYDDNADGQIDKFLVRDKSGMTRYYGYTNQSRIEAQGQPHFVTWMLNRVSDKFGNYIDFDYAKRTTGDQRGEFWIDFIEYFNTHDQRLGRVEFDYDGSLRSDTNFGYSYGGSKIARLALLRGIDVFGHDGTGSLSRSRQYNLSYEYNSANGFSQLTEVQECDGAGAACLAPTRIDYINGQNGFATTDFATLSSYISDQFMDVNGDGRIDQVYEWNYLWTIRLSGSHDTSYVTTIDSHNQAHATQYTHVIDYNGDGRQDLLVANTTTGRWEILESTGTSFVLRDTGRQHFDAYLYDPLAMDLDGDALPEIVFRHQGWLKFYRNSGGSYSGPIDTGLRVSTTQILTPLEYDGDGQADIAVNMTGCSPNGPPTDPDDPVDGSGPPVHPRGQLYKDAVSRGTTHCSETAGILTWSAPDNNLVQLPMTGMTDTSKIGGAQHHNQLMDFNADGLTDLAVAPTSDTGRWRFYVNKGANWQLCWSGHNGRYRHLATVFDFDGDGRQELWQPENNLWHRLRPNVGENTISFTAVASAPFTDRSFFMDWTGDGLGDLVVSQNGTYFIRNHNGSKRGLLKSIENGLGNETQVAYVAQSDISADVVYAGETGTPVFPNRHVSSPIYLVRSVAADSGLLSSTGSDMKITTNYTYHGAKLNQHGRGSLGFSKIEAHNVNTEIVTYNTHSQLFPYIGMVTRSEQWTPDVIVQGIDWEDIDDDFQPCTPASWPCNYPRSTAATTNGAKDTAPVTQQRNTVLAGEKLSETINILASRSYDVGGAGERYFPYVSTSTEKQFRFHTVDVIRRTVTSSILDDYGNTTSIVVTVDDGAGGDLHRVSTVNQFQNWANSRWCLGRLMSTSVTHERTDNGSGGPLSDTRESSFDYDNTTCQLTREVIEADSSDWMLQTDYAHDVFGNRRLVTVSGPGIASRSTTTLYDMYGQFPIEQSNALNHVSVSTWDYTYGHKLSMTDVNGFTGHISYDTLGRVIRETAARETVWSEFNAQWCTESSCESNNAVYRVVTGSSLVTATGHIQKIVEYDQLGREVLSKQRAFDGTFIYNETLYDPIGRAYAVSTPHFAGDVVCWTVNEYDSLGRIIAEYRPAEMQDCLNLGGIVPDPSDYESIDSSYGNKTSFYYDGLETRVVDSLGRVVTRVANVMDRLIRVYEHDDSNQLLETAYDYDPLGNTTWVRDAQGNTSRMGYNLRGFKISMDDPDLGHWEYDYNTLGELIWQRDAKHQLTTMDYDLLGRMTRRTVPEGVTQWYFDESERNGNPVYHGAALGRVTRVAGPDAYLKLFRYTGSYGEMTQKSERLDGTWYCNDFHYDDQGRIGWTLAPAMGYANTCTAQNRLQLVTTFNAYGYPYLVREYRDQTYRHTFWRALEMDALGNVTKEKTHHELVTTRHDYDPATAALLTTTGGTNGAIQNEGYEWDAVGNLGSRSDFNQGWTEQFSYDRLYRLKQVRLVNTVDGISDVTANNRYDAIGNILCKGVTGTSREGCSDGYRNYSYGSENTSAAGDAGPHAVTSVLTDAEQRTFDYDNNGNLIRVNGGDATRSVDWYSFNRPKQISRKDHSAEFWYRPDDYSRWKQISVNSGETTTQYYVGGVYQRRVQSAEPDEHIYYVRAGNRVVGQVKRYGDVVTANTEQYFHHDHLGSVVAVSNDVGDVIERLSYDAWGKRRYVNNWVLPGPQDFLYAMQTQLGFTGHEHIDHLGLINMNGRVYDFEIGRFLSADPFVQYPASTQGLNRYAYVQNNPLSYSDPSGFSVRSFFARVAGTIATAITGQPWIGYLVQGFLSSGKDLKAMSIGLVLGTVLGQSLYTGYQYLRAGLATRKHGGRFINGMLRAMKDRANSEFLSIGEQYLIDTGARVAFAIREASASDTAAIGGGGKGAGTTNGAHSDAFDNASKIKFEAELGVRIRQWLEMGIKQDGRFFAKAGGKTVSIKLDDSGSLVFSAGQVTTQIQVPQSDFDDLAIHARSSFNIDLSLIGGTIAVTETGHIKWQAYLKSSGILGRLGIRGKAGFSGIINPSRAIRKSPFGKAGYQYRRGTTDHVDRCLNSDFVLEGC